LDPNQLVKKDLRFMKSPINKSLVLGIVLFVNTAIGEETAIEEVVVTGTLASP
jgi:hypothetical protein